MNLTSGTKRMKNGCRPANAIAPLSAPDKPLPAVVMEPLKRSRLRQLDRRQWVAAGLAVLIAASGLVVWRRSSAPGRDISAYTTTVRPVSSMV